MNGVAAAKFPLLLARIVGKIGVKVRARATAAAFRVLLHAPFV